MRAFVGSTFSYGLRLAADIVLPALAMGRVLQINPWPIFFPLRAKHTAQDMLFGFLQVAGVLGATFVLFVRPGWLRLEGWAWQQMPPDAWARTLWVGFLVNLCVATGEPQNANLVGALTRLQEPLTMTRVSLGISLSSNSWLLRSSPVGCGSGCETEVQAIAEGINQYPPIQTVRFCNLAGSRIVC